MRPALSGRSGTGTRGQRITSTAGQPDEAHVSSSHPGSSLAADQQPAQDAEAIDGASTLEPETHATTAVPMSASVRTAR
jgi:hypothetical protein